MSVTESSPLRILRVADVPDNRHGGMSRTMYCTGDCLIARGHHVDYLFHDSFRWKIPVQIQRYLRAWEAGSIIKRRIAGGDTWDVIEVHEPLSIGYGCVRRRNPRLPPMVAFSYGIESRSYDAMRSYRRLKDIPFSLKSRTTSRALVWQARLGVGLSSHVICSNQQDVDYLATNGHMPRSKLTRHHSGVERVFLEAGASIHERPMKGILFMGNWIERKGILDVIPAVTAALGKYPDAYLTVAGCNCPAEVILPSFPESVRRRVRVIPHISDLAGLIRVYQDHAVMLLPSYFEGHPLVMVEAAAMGLAIITTPVCGMLDFIEDDVSGLFSPVGDSVRLSQTLERLLSDHDKAVRLGQGARVVAMSHTWDSAAAKIERAYRSVLKDN
jgi:glycosyltransferase involved in cell wall biosynthesis